MNIANDANALKSRARRFGFQVFLEPARPEGWYATIRPAGNALVEPMQIHAPTRDEAIATASRLFEDKLADQLVTTLRQAGVAIPNWTPGQDWDEHVEAMATAVREHDLSL
ncbi:MAG: hypothetical protein EXQ67_00800 [Thermoleophilia bacterium]|nr:hypothetical protein [Thermoleophilia bacterium]